MFSDIYKYKDKRDNLETELVVTTLDWTGPNGLVKEGMGESDKMQWGEPTEDTLTQDAGRLLIGGSARLTLSEVTRLRDALTRHLARYPEDSGQPALAGGV